MPWSEIPSAIPAVIGIPAIVAACVSALLRRSENAQLQSQASELERLKASLRALEGESKTRFDWLHQTRAEAIIRLYALIVDVNTRVNRLLATLTHAVPSEDAKVELYEEADEAFRRFHEQHAKDAIFFPQSINQLLAKLDALLWQKFVVARVYGRDQTPTDREKLFQEDWRDVTSLVDEIKAPLQDLLDVNQSVMRPSEPFQL